MITCFIRYEIDASKVAAFERYARAWRQAFIRREDRIFVRPAAAPHAAPLRP